MKTQITHYKLEIFLPASHLAAVREALFAADAGHIGRYDHCLSWSPVHSCWRPLSGTHPFLGQEGITEEAEELRLEVTVRPEQLEKVLQAVRAVHPYEEPVINVLPMNLPLLGMTD